VALTAVVLLAADFYGRRVAQEGDLAAIFGEVVRRMRRAQGVSQEAFAAKAGIDRAYMGSIERGLRNPSLTIIYRVAVGLELPMAEVVSEVEREFRQNR
jgi:transcriptional regulator with XRE-family HTH domain